MAADSRNRAAVNDGNDRYGEVTPSEDMEQRANYVRGHKRELKWHKEAMEFLLPALRD